MSGNGPIQTSPLYCSDESLLVYARGDFWSLSPQWNQLAYGTDGTFAPDAPWVLASATVDFQSQGVAAQQVIALSGAGLKGAPVFFAIDSVLGNSATLRRASQDPGVGQPPAPIGGLSGVTFEVRSWAPYIEQASYDMKKLMAIDETIFYRSSDWVYQGAEDPYRAFRDAVAWYTLMDAYERETRDANNAGDFARKAKRARERYEEAKELIEVRWGPYGNSAEPSNVFGCKLSR